MLLFLSKKKLINIFFIFLVSSYALDFLMKIIIYSITPITVSITIKTTNIKQIFFIIILIPVIEELLFRSILVCKRRNISLFLTALVYILSSLFFSNFLSRILLSSLLGLFFYSQKFSLPKLKYIIYVKYHKVLIFLSIFSFAFLHLFNYEFITSKQLYVIPLLLIPKLYAGVILSFVCIRFGLVYSILFHIIHNGLIFMYIFLLK